MGTGEGHLAREGRQKKLCSDPGPWARFHQQGLPLPLPHSPWALGYPLHPPCQAEAQSLPKRKRGTPPAGTVPSTAGTVPSTASLAAVQPLPQTGEKPFNTHSPTQSPLPVGLFCAWGGRYLSFHSGQFPSPSVTPKAA